MDELLLHVLDSQYERIRTQMDLRPPQSCSLEVLRDILKCLPRPVLELPPDELARRVQREHPEWTFPEGFPVLTFALATGVGKTRLMGALMALLYRTGQSRNFVLLAPRDAILRKLMAETQATNPKYMFVEPSVVPQPRVCHKGNLLQFDPNTTQGLYETGPNVFVLSPQLISTDGRIRRRSEFAGSSIFEYLRSCDDLVVCIDESHHLTTREFTDAEATWGAAVRELAPKFAFAMTATPRADENVAYEYGLRQCLQEGLYTKRVRLIVHSKAASISDDEYDAFVLDEGLARLDAKREAIDDLRAGMPSFPQLEPVMLVCARSQDHADEVGRWLEEERGLSPEEVLVIHAARKTEPDLLRLKQLERPNSRIRVVVQVHVLDEGWDVTNVYVITPLRYVQSFTNARQVMGRGLRLPAGFRVNDEEVDRLDILAFGQDTFQTVYDEAVREFGGPDRSSFEVTGADGRGAAGVGGRTVEDNEGEATDIRIEIAVQHEKLVAIPRLDLHAPEPDLDISSLTPRGMTMATLDIGTMLTGSATATAAMPRRITESLIVDRVFREFEALSAPLHQRRIQEIARQLLDECMVDGRDVAVDHNLAAKLIVQLLHEKWVAQSPTYAALGTDVEVTTAPVAVRVPSGFTGYLDSQTINWRKDTCARIPVGNWRNSVLEACRFDSKPEFEMAKKLDIMGEVTLWLRNDPAQINMPTLRRSGHAPDFVVWAVVSGNEQVLLLEVKGEHLWSGPRSEARTNARDARLWVDAANSHRGRDLFASALVLGGDVDLVQTYQQLEEYDATDRWNE